MPRRLVILLFAAALACAQLSCAVGGRLVPERQSMPVARAALRPEYRVFYDALQDYGDWVLIEPYGHVFRPRVSYASWGPYGDGFWAPTDLYGWVWMSAEPFGWATYHYGRWFNDPYQGWVWIPGIDWGPAWVAWQASDQYVGWAPLGPGSTPYRPVAAGAFSYVPAKTLGVTDLQRHVVSEPSAATAGAQPVENLTEEGGTVINRGPNLEWVERQAGPLRRVKIDDLVTIPAPAASPTVTEVPATSDSKPRQPAPDPATLTTKRAAERVAREVKALTERGGGLPARISQVRPFGIRGGATAPTPAPAPPDSAR